MPIIAIYPRKSKFTGKGESVQTQIDLCREYCSLHFENPTYIVYDEDEGYSGGNTKRPAFRRMMHDARSKKFDILCCYRLDRISRNVSDFSQTLDELHGLGIAFVSLKEQFDTSTPMGRAMIYIASVFAQLERDTLTERINDNLRALAKEGHWLGGMPPTGYRSRRVEFERNGKKRKFFVLTECESELSIVRILFAQYLEKRSYAGVETYCLQHCIQSKNGKNFSRATIKAILQNPVYCIADSVAWDHFSHGDYNLCAPESEFDGIRGIQAFSRTTNNRPSSQLKPTADWIIAVGQHKGVICGEDWVTVQQIISARGACAYQAPRSTTALLSGILKCGICGSHMRPKMHSKRRADGSRGVSYHCVLKASSRGTRCQNKNVDAEHLDEQILQMLSRLAQHDPSIAAASAIDFSLLSSQQNTILQQIASQRLELDLLEEQQRRLLSKISDYDLSDALINSINQEHQRLASEVFAIQSYLHAAAQELAFHRNAPTASQACAQLAAPFRSQLRLLSYAEKRQLLQAVIAQAIWDGERIHIKLSPPRSGCQGCAPIHS